MVQGFKGYGLDSTELVEGNPFQAGRPPLPFGITSNLILRLFNL
jgi:hypothetical protein